MADISTKQPLKDLLDNPQKISEVMEDPGKFGMDVYKSLSNQNKMYLSFAAGVGLIIYGFMLRKQEK
ncbi:hypothetical protein [Pontibacter harenae]|uniref:hypothetical protein n=1 Tax=Pontibacter harenae TaxID=2894083 RepID=UPI001E373B7A|nr:hypothetical protein [Pontibacter harenae]MCC9167309.1 hypothetical protein [Pontibacter harenae]